MMAPKKVPAERIEVMSETCDAGMTKLGSSVPLGGMGMPVTREMKTARQRGERGGNAEMRCGGGGMTMMRAATPSSPLPMFPKLAKLPSQAQSPDHEANSPSIPSTPPMYPESYPKKIPPNEAKTHSK